MYIKPCSKEKRTLGSISCITTTFRSLRPISIQLCSFGVAPGHRLVPYNYSSSPELILSQLLVPTWGEDTQRAVVWTRLREHHKLAYRSLAKINEQFLTLCQEQQLTQVKSSHEPLSCDINEAKYSTWLIVLWIDPHVLFSLRSLFLSRHVIIMWPHCDLLFLWCLLSSNIYCSMTHCPGWLHCPCDVYCSCDSIVLIYYKY